MDEEYRMKKIIVIGIVAFFIGVGIQPSIATVELDDICKDYVDIEIDICGLPGVKSYNVASLFVLAWRSRW